MPTFDLTNLTNNNFANSLSVYLNPTPYFLVLVFLFLLILIYGIKSGRGRMILLVLSLYIAIILTGLFPYREYLLKNISAGEPYFIELGLFLISFLLVLILLLRSPLRTIAIKSKGHIFQILALSILALGILVSHLTVSLPAEYLDKLNHPVFTYFRSETAQFWWALAGVLFLAAMRRKGE